MVQLRLLSPAPESPLAVRLLQTAAGLGITDAETAASELAGREPSGAGAFAVDVAGLAKAWSEPALGRLADWAQRCRQPLLLVVTDDAPATRRLLGELTGGVLGEVAVVAAAAAVSFAAEARPVVEELAGSEHRRQPGPALHFAAGTCTPLMRVGGGASFVSWAAGGAPRFAWATPSILDPVTPLRAEVDFEHALDRVLPLVIFLRQALGEAVWTNPHRDAGFVIDDPLLVPRYGFIDFPALLQSARRHAYHVTLAFIPWNAWRTRDAQARLFRDHADCFTVCVHGCDHNRNEYGVADYPLLADKNRVALERMERLVRRTGIPFASVMVCPQEQCSREGWRSFADTPGLLGMVNTACLPRNTPNDRVAVVDLLQPAHDRYFGFPIFKRYYPGDWAQFALTAFLGRPAILVEHHDFFRQGLGGIEDFVVRLRGISPRVQWRPMADLVTTTHQRRRGAEGRLEVRFFTDRFRFEPLGAQGPVAFRRYVETVEAVEAVLVDGSPVPFTLEGPFVGFTLERAEAREIEVRLCRPRPRRVYSHSAWHQGGVVVRRILSEFRDNLLARSPRAAALGRGLVGRLGWRGGARAR